MCVKLCWAYYIARSLQLWSLIRQNCKHFNFADRIVHIWFTTRRLEHCNAFLRKTLRNMLNWLAVFLVNKFKYLIKFKRFKLTAWIAESLAPILIWKFNHLLRQLGLKVVQNHDVVLTIIVWKFSICKTVTFLHFINYLAFLTLKKRRVIEASQFGLTVRKNHRTLEAIVLRSQTWMQTVTGKLRRLKTW